MSKILALLKMYHQRGILLFILWCLDQNKRTWLVPTMKALTYGKTLPHALLSCFFTLRDQTPTLGTTMGDGVWRVDGSIAAHSA
jgi:hypothetical protein